MQLGAVGAHVHVGVHGHTAQRVGAVAGHQEPLSAGSRQDGGVGQCAAGDREDIVHLDGAADIERPPGEGQALGAVDAVDHGRAGRVDDGDVLGDVDDHVVVGAGQGVVLPVKRVVPGEVPCVAIPLHGRQEDSRLQRLESGPRLGKCQQLRRHGSLLLSARPPDPPRRPAAAGAGGRAVASADDVSNPLPGANAKRTASRRGMPDPPGGRPPGMKGVLWPLLMSPYYTTFSQMSILWRLLRSQQSRQLCVGRVYSFCYLGSCLRLTRGPRRMRCVVSSGWHGGCLYHATRRRSPPKAPVRYEAVLRAKRQYGYKVIARCLQRLESVVVIDGVCGRLVRDHPEVRFLTIHDAALAVADSAELVRGLMVDEFRRWGVRARVKDDRRSPRPCWTPRRCAGTATRGRSSRPGRGSAGRSTWPRRTRACAGARWRGWTARRRSNSGRPAR